MNKKPQSDVSWEDTEQDMHALADANERHNERFVINRFFALVYLVELLIACALTYDEVKGLHDQAFDSALTVCFIVHVLVASLFAGLHYVSLLHANTPKTSVENEQ